jgi:two-component system phosphate regulon sensor histidine kinase PhoR
VSATDGLAALEQLRMLVEWLPSGVLGVGRDMNVVAANTAAHRLFHPEAIVIGSPLPPLRDAPLAASFVESLFDSKIGVQRCELRPDPDHVFRVIGVPPGSGGTALLLIDDTSAHERLGRAEREFIANAAHELLTPVTGIVGAAHALESGAKLEPELRDRFITHITRECNRLARISRGVLVLARAQSGQQPPRPENVALASILEDAADGAGSTGDVTITCPRDLTAFVDRDLAEQAFTNLIGNARRHSDNAPVLVAAYVSADDDVRVEISDQGGGFKGADVQHIGRRFASGEGRGGRGYGLGLSIAMQAVQMCRGNLTIQPRDGRGTVARVELPRGTRKP